MPNVGSLRKHGVVVEAEPMGAGNTSVARGQGTFPVFNGELALCRPDPHSALEAVALAVLIRGSGPRRQEVGAGEAEVNFPLPGRFGDFYPIRLVQHHDDATSPPYRLISSDLFHL